MGNELKGKQSEERAYERHTEKGSFSYLRPTASATNPNIYRFSSHQSLD